MRLPIGFLLFMLVAYPVGAKESMRDKIGQLLVVGFRGFTIEPESIIAKNLAERNLGGIILFDKDVTTKSDQRNIQNPEQVRRLNEAARRLSRVPLFTSVDQEGGMVARLKLKHGFPKTFSALKMAELPTTEFENACASLARTVAQAGFNLNFAPSVDLNLNPTNPIVGAYERSFSADPKMVTEKATAFVGAHRREGVLTALKHFPGHGSSKGDTHLGVVEVTEVWKEIELEPFQNLIAAGKAPMIMTAHVYNRRLDENYPATLSPKIIPKFLRERMQYDGVVISDDMQMGAITQQYGMKEAVRLALNADIDMLTFGNNVAYDEHVMEKVVAAIEELIREGAITEDRIERSYRRVLRLKSTLN